MLYARVVGKRVPFKDVVSRLYATVVGKISTTFYHSKISDLIVNHFSGSPCLTLRGRALMTQLQQVNAMLMAVFFIPKD